MILDVNKLPLEGEDGLFSFLGALTDRRKPRGLRHSLQSIPAVATCAVLAGQRHFSAIEEWARNQSKEISQTFGVSLRSAPE